MTSLLLAAILILSSFVLGALASWWWIGWRVTNAEAAASQATKKLFDAMADPALHPAARELALVIDWVRVDHQSRSAVVTSGTNAQTWEVVLRHRAGGQVDLSAKGCGGLSEAVGQAMDAMRRAAN
jgi:hypothetical protein